MRLYSRRPGNVIALTGVSMFLFMGIAAIVIDLGLASLGRREMQTAVNTAALEGLRGRDDSTGRTNASRMTALVFDDDLNPENGDTLQLGAGPVIAYQQGIVLPNTSFRASRLITEENLGVYKPRQSNGNPGLELNENNDPSGDMVSGTYRDGMDHTEDSATSSTPYGRADFIPAASGNDAFLVRMRRTSETAEAGAISAGPPLPSLFGRGAISSTAFANRQERGTFVRATAIARAVPAKSAGPTGPAGDPNPVPGVAPLGLKESFWEMPIPGPVTVDTNTGEITDGNKNSVGWISRITALSNAIQAGDMAIQVSSTTGFPATFPFHVRIDQETMEATAMAAGATGWTVTRDPVNAMAHNANAAVRFADPTVIGEPFRQGTFDGFETGLNPSGDLYIPIFQSVGNQGSLIVGFSFAQLGYDPTTRQLTITRKDQIAQGNASPILVIPISKVNPALAAADIEAVFKANADLGSSPAANVLRAPALVRSIQ